jgi:signal transduction histidine kinase
MRDESRPLELERLRAEVGDLRQQLAELSSSSDKFLAVATHDLRSPLASLRLIADMLEQPGRVSAESRQLIVTMQSCLVAMEALVDDVLNAARLNRPGSTLVLEPFEVNGLIEDTVAGLFPVAIRTGVRLDASLSPGAGTVTADRRRIGQVLANLIGNGLKFTPSGGTVLVASDGDAGGIEVSVSDTGPGLSDDDKRRLFSSFFRGSAQPAHGEPCTGLGLYIVRRIAEAHGGTVGAESQPGQGSLFYLRLPRRPNSAMRREGDRS